MGALPPSELAEAIKHMEHTAEYRAVVDRLTQMRDRAIRALAAAPTWDAARFEQGRIAAIESALQLPQTLVSELREEAKR
jgi:hypothetical protein